MSQRLYMNGHLSKEKLQAFAEEQLDKGMVITAVVPRGQGGKNDVIYMREAVGDEIAQCRQMIADRKAKKG